MSDKIQIEADEIDGFVSQIEQLVLKMYEVLDSLEELASVDFYQKGKSLHAVETLGQTIVKYDSINQHYELLAQSLMMTSDRMREMDQGLSGYIESK